MNRVVKFKPDLKNILCLAMAFCMILSLFTPLAKILVKADESSSAKMLYIDFSSYSSSNNMNELYQLAPVEVGQTYYYTFSLSDSIDSFEMICRSTNGYRTGVNANATQISKVSYDGYSTYTYSFTIPAKDNGNADMSEKVYFGIRLKAACKGYFFGASVYNSKDENKTELFANPVFASGVLDGWYLGWVMNFDSSANKGLSKWNNDYISLELVDYDESLMAVQKKMLYVKSSVQRELLQRADIEAGKTYHFAFSLTDTVTDFELLCRADNDRSEIDAQITQISKVDKGTYSVYVYSYTIPETYKKYGSTDTAMTDSVFFGLRFAATDSAYEAYLADFTVYNSADETKSELLQSTNLNNGLNYWLYSDRGAWNNSVWFAVGSDASLAGATEWSNDNSLIKVMDYDESIFSSGAKMLRINYTTLSNANNENELYQLATVEVGKTYYYTFSLTDTIDSFAMICRSTNDYRNSVNANITAVSTVENNGYTTYTYSYTIPEKDNKDKAMSEKVYFGIQFKSACDGYFFGASVYNSADENKTELFSNPDFSLSVLDGWYLGWVMNFSSSANSGLSKWNNENVALEIVDYDESLFESESDKDDDKDDDNDDDKDDDSKEDETTPKMLHITTTRGKELYQRAEVEAGKTYYFTFSVTDTIQNIKLVCKADDSRPDVEADITLVDEKDNYGYKTYTYSYTIPETDVDGKAVTPNIFFGIKLSGSQEGYFFNASVYGKDDESKTELFKNPDFSVGLDKWAWGWDMWFATGGNPAGLSTWTNEDATTTLEVVDYDESLFEETVVTPPSKKMLYINTTSGKDLIQRVNVKAGETYNFTFSLSNSVSFFSAVCYADDSRPAVDANIQLTDKTDKDGYSVYTYSYTIPETDSNGDAITSSVFFGVKLSGNAEGYFFDASVYKADDDKKTELFENADFSSALDKWAWGWDMWFATAGNPEGLTEWSNEKTTLKLVDYDESLMKSNSDTTAQMLYFKTSTPKELMQRVTVNPGVTYHFTFSLTDTVSSFKMVCLADSKRNVIDADIKLVSEVGGDGYTTYTYSYTIPETYVDNDGNDAAMTDSVFFGIKCSVSGQGCFFNPSVYKADDKYKIELFENSDFSVGLDKWAWGWDMWFATAGNPAGLTEWSNTATTLKLMPFNQSFIDELIASMPGKKMVYFINGAISSHFASRVELEPGGEYYMVFSAFSTGDIGLKVAEDGQRNAINVEKTLISVEEHGNYNTYTYKFVMPEDLENNLVFVGPIVNYYTEGFIFDMELYSADDAKKTNLWSNASFGVGLDGWIWNWHAWFGYTPGNGTFEWTNGANTLNVMDFDLAKIDKLIAELNINDGVWWNPDDVSQESNAGTASLVGTISDQNGTPISNVKFVLESNDNSYNASGNSKGKFEFKDFTAGFYELYAVNSQGEKISTGFYTNFADGDVVTLNLVCDSSGAVSEADAEVKPTGAITGTVYTADLKTVPDLKIYIRGVGETVTDENGSFEFSEVPVGDYEIYTVLADGSEYVFRTISIKENVQLSVKLKYDPQSSTSADVDQGFNWIWVVIPCMAVLLIAAGIIVFIIIKKKKASKN